MHISPSELSGQLVHCAVPYAHVMGYKTELYIVDHVSADDEERVKSRIEMAKEIIERSEIYGGDLEQVWLSMHPYTDWCLAEGDLLLVKIHYYSNNHDNNNLQHI